MPERIIIRGDSYETRRPLFRTQFIAENGGPMNLTGCTIRTTYKAESLSPVEDPMDESAFIRHTLIINEAGNAITQEGLYLMGDVTQGSIEERLTPAETRGLPLDTTLYSDIELIDANGEVITWLISDTIRAQDAYTNRTT